MTPVTEQDKRAALNKFAAKLAKHHQDIYMHTRDHHVAEKHYGAWKAYEAVVAFEGDWLQLHALIDNQYENYMYVLKFSDDEEHWGAFEAYENTTGVRSKPTRTPPAT